MHIDKRLSSEIELNQQRLVSMQTDIDNKFSKVDSIKKHLEAQMEDSKRKKEFLSKKRD